MTRKTKHALLIGGGALALILATAGASAYVAQRAMVEPDKAKSQKEEIVWDEPKQAPQPQQQAAKSCDDANVVGAAIGAVAGGVAGNQIGSGRGQDLATVGGAIGGGVLGQQYIPTRNVLCP